MEQNKAEARSNLMKQPPAFDLHKNLKKIRRIYGQDAANAGADAKSQAPSINFTKKYDHLVERTQFKKYQDDTL